jgi:uncharacterized caspase-like protein
MSSSTIYKPTYEKSWALVIGINDYRAASPLGYARQDAEAFAEILTSHFGFLQNNVVVLLDQDATRARILSEFLHFTEDCISPDDRIAVFFAGHGCTRTGKRGEVGFLVPVEGDPSNLNTLIRWDELTGNAELIPAKHLLFVMDACYGGLAIRRNFLQEVLGSSKTCFSGTPAKFSQQARQMKLSLIPVVLVLIIRSSQGTSSTPWKEKPPIPTG